MSCSIVVFAAIPFVLSYSSFLPSFLLVLVDVLVIIVCGHSKGGIAVVDGMPSVTRLDVYSRHSPLLLCTRSLLQGHYQLPHQIQVPVTTIPFLRLLLLLPL